MRSDLNRWHRLTGGRVALWGFFLFLYIPLIALIVLSFNGNRSATIWTEFSVYWYIHMLSNDDLLAAARNSLIVAFCAATLATTLTTAAAIVIARNRFAAKPVAEALFRLPLLVPDIVFAIGALIFFLGIGLAPGMTTLILAHTAFCVPFAYLPVRARLSGFDWSIVDASADLYSEPGRTLRKVIIPLLTPGIMAAFLLAFIVSLDDFIVSFFVSGPGSITVPVYVFGLMRLGISPEVNAIASAMVMISTIITAVFFALDSKSTTKGTYR